MHIAYRDRTHDIIFKIPERAISAHAQISGNQTMADMEFEVMTGRGQMTGFEADPAAAFLAREREELADIVEDVVGITEKRDDSVSEEEEDPAAAFLAREQEELAGIMGEVEGVKEKRVFEDDPAAAFLAREQEELAGIVEGVQDKRNGSVIEDEDPAAAFLAREQEELADIVEKFPTRKENL